MINYKTFYFVLILLIFHTSLMSEAETWMRNSKNLIFLGSSCVYPVNCKRPIKEDYLLTGKLEKTNEPYAIAKIAGIKMCESYNNQYKTNYLCLMPTNTFGPNDNYDLENSHFIPAILRKIYLAEKNKIELKILIINSFL